MENIQQKAAFLQHEFTRQLAGIDVATPGNWGKMNLLQMIEHMSDYVRIASGRTPVEVITPEENLPRMQGFLASEKPFKENTPNSLMPETPSATRHQTKEEAISELQNEINYFFEVYDQEPGKKIANPFFGQLDYKSQVQLLYKHAIHHLRQFGAITE